MRAAGGPGRDGGQSPRGGDSDNPALPAPSFLSATAFMNGPASQTADWLSCRRKAQSAAAELPAPREASVASLSLEWAASAAGSYRPPCGAPSRGGEGGGGGDFFFFISLTIGVLVQLCHSEAWLRLLTIALGLPCLVTVDIRDLATGKGLVWSETHCVPAVQSDSGPRESAMALQPEQAGRQGTKAGVGKRQDSFPASAGGSCRVRTAWTFCRPRGWLSPPPPPASRAFS